MPCVTGMSHAKAFELAFNSRIYKSFRYLFKENENNENTRTFWFPCLSCIQRSYHDSPRNIIFWIFAVIRQAPKQVDSVAQNGETVTCEGSYNCFRQLWSVVIHGHTTKIAIYLSGLPSLGQGGGPFLGGFGFSLFHSHLLACSS